MEDKEKGVPCFVNSLGKTVMTNPESLGATPESKDIPIDKISGAVQYLKGKKDAEEKIARHLNKRFVEEFMGVESMDGITLNRKAGKILSEICKGEYE